jgi:hypothetical protein
MSDERWNPHHEPVEAPKRPPEPLWTVTVAGVAWSADVRFRASAGWESQVLRDGELFTARGAFVTKEAAVGWADEQRRDIDRRWIDDGTD